MQYMLKPNANSNDHFNCKYSCFIAKTIFIVFDLVYGRLVGRGHPEIGNGSLRYVRMLDLCVGRELCADNVESIWLHNLFA